jgi:Ca-activated chloride channel family protein
MPKPHIANIIVRLGCIASLLVPLPAFQSSQQKRNVRIHVVVVRDAGLFTLCLSGGGPGQAGGSAQDRIEIWRRPDGQQVISFLPEPPMILPAPAVRHAPEILSEWNPQVSEPPSTDRRELVRAASESDSVGIPESDMKSRIEKELRRRKGYVLADSPEDADFVFLIEDVYVPATNWHIVDRLEVTELGGDRNANFLQTAMSVVVPSAAYREIQANSAALLEESIWEGYTVQWDNQQLGMLMPAKPENLVGQFHTREKRQSGSLRLCAAAGRPLRIPAPHLEESKAKPVSNKSVPQLPEVHGREQTVAPNDKTIRVEVSLVTVPTIATDPGGKYIPDLRKSDFHVYEDGREQRIDRLMGLAEPFSVALMMDSSSSTRFKSEEIQNAALAFFKALRPQDRLMILSLGSRIYLDSELTGDRNQLTRAIFSPRVEGSTRLYDAVDLVLTERLSRISGRKAIILFTDGVDTGSRLVSAADSLANIQESEVLVYVIQYDTAKENMRQLPRNARPGAAPEGVFDNRVIYARATQYLQDLSDGTGGHLYRAETITDLDDAFTSIAEELRHQYTLSYYSSNPKRDGSYRHIRVSTDMPGINIRARTGYRAGGKPPDNN